MNLADKYTYQTAWSEEDGEFVATVLEFPSLSWLDATATTAEAELRSVVEETLEDMQRNNEHIPEPFGQRSYSGKFNLRIPQSLHRDLTIEAEREGVSLNTLIVQKLASA
ncbi:toxin-antitoxin system HicB family antitoxin [Corynebacterium aurimucosum]|uniref:Toxin-antitoxin system HicB family antitoxin n=4 Tax=Corynebacterium TaxID=1716 RepID=A0ABU9UJX5_9CORY|nr:MULTISPECIES: toxin-antitoxin system HicB family antitoxin [Corynebacterium]MDK6806589.1 toxin-antitoxin system HicB family antitoxin [Corynebacterium aurimucosum]MCL8494026.1 toxin-antitoxin system HicB family antitoxin [Corynebacterium intestinale]MCP1390262.1 toxin-antitoxin system HicB family antitoxin [Corynebacterium intestinale]MCZ9298958.1 toxin-antitoxin system HicB family antitoxin [Corynebacterium hesseae]MTE10829.1 toxin-antitoxin system HicB family antitoxin [Corynebacterium gu